MALISLPDILPTQWPPLTTIETDVIHGGMNLLGGILILIVGWWLSRRAARWTRTALDEVRGFDATLKPLITSLVRYGILIAAAIAVLERFGIQTTSLITVLGAAGIAIGLALQGTLSNVASGVMLLVLRPFKVGDWITIANVNQSGSVREIGLFTTIIISADQAYVSLPNAAIFSSPIVNASREPMTRINFTVFIDIANDVDAALKMIEEALAADQRILKVPPPATGIVSLKDYSAELLVRCWVCNADGEIVKFDLNREIRSRFERAGIALPAQRQIMAEAGNHALHQKPPLRRSG